MINFSQATSITVVARILSLLPGIAISIILACILGPEDKGIYTLAVLLPALIVTFASCIFFGERVSSKKHSK